MAVFFFRVLVGVLIGIVVVFAIVGLQAKEQEAAKQSESGVEAETEGEEASLQTPEIQSESNTENLETARVVRVVDGDTIDISIENVVERVRLIGIDTPESVKIGAPVECFAKEAAAKTTELLAKKSVRLAKDVSERDKYGRLLRYVYVDEELVNEQLVREGFARVYTYPPDVAFNERFLEAEREAREAGRGLWSACNEEVVSAPLSQNTQHSQENIQCIIKGNINAEGERIFHVPGCTYYSQTVISEGKGERWFCSEEEAKIAGWRKALNCSV